ncbi:MAG: aminopeptidase P family protein [Candidatus Stahlbacteria bacterium]|nr:MAG: aminopeptidase P family protein [Candidatus Stahlbacteria bacterium]
MEPRLAKIRRRIKKEGLDGLLITNLKNVHYLSGYTGSNGYLFIARRMHFFTDFRYQEQVKREVTPKALTHIITEGFSEGLASLTELKNVTKIGFEADHLTVSTLQRLKKRLRKVGKFKWVPTKGWVQELRNIKDSEEVALIAKAARITDKTLAEVLDLVKPGVTERELAAEIAYRFMRYTGLPPAFAPIVASGPNSAMPHAKPTARKLRKGDLVTFDLGAQWKGYSADMTRTVVVGKASKKQKDIYSIVLRAQQHALDGIHAGIDSKAADAIARDVIKEAGYGSYFGHALGHGVGLEIHDGLRIAATSKDKIPAGAVVTVEPGIYLPGCGGVRIEDLVYVKADGVRILSSSPRAKLAEL